MAKIAVALEQALARRRLREEAGRAKPRVIAGGTGWSVADVLCTSGPQDRPFEEQHTRYTIAMVVAGTFQYRTALGAGLMAPGSVMLGNPGLAYECGHEHAEGDRCVVFWYEPEYFEELTGSRFRVAHVPPLRDLAPLVVRAGAGAIGGGGSRRPMGRACRAGRGPHRRTCSTAVITPRCFSAECRSAYHAGGPDDR